MSVVCLAGGTGGAKLAAGLQDVVGRELSVIANTADDVEVHGLLVSPDPDLITYWLAGEIDEERGWGIRDDTFVVAERLERLGAPGWFRLSDRDLATCLYRTHFIAEGGTADRRSGADRARRWAYAASVLPMCEQARAHPGADPGRDARAAGVPDPRPWRGADRGGRARGDRGCSTPPPRCWRPSPRPRW